MHLKINEYIEDNNIEALLFLLRGTNQYSVAIEKAASAGKNSIVDALIAVFKNDPAQQQAAYDAALYGYVLGGHTEGANNMRRQGANETYAEHALRDLSNQQPAHIHQPGR